MSMPAGGPADTSGQRRRRPDSLKLPVGRRVPSNDETPLLAVGGGIREAWLRLHVHERIHENLDGDVGRGWSQGGLQPRTLHRTVRRSRGGQRGGSPFRHAPK